MRISDWSSDVCSSDLSRNGIFERVHQHLPGAGQQREDGAAVRFMKHTAILQAAGETVVKVPTRRTLAKQQTRAKVLAAARRLFSEEGYEGATIRDIAAAAGMSTGAVFATRSEAHTSE